MYAKGEIHIKYSIFFSFIKNMPQDITLKINNQLDALKDQVKDNIKAEEQRGANLSNLEERTTGLMETSIAFKKQAEKTKYQMMWECYKWYGIAILLLLLLFSPIIKLLFWK